MTATIVGGLAFDLGGTLTPLLAPILSRSWRTAIATEVEPSIVVSASEAFDYCEQHYWRSDLLDEPADAPAHVLTQAFERIGVRVSKEIIRRVVVAAERSFGETLRILPEGARILRSARSEGIPVGILSNLLLSARPISACLAEEGLSECVQVVMTSSDLRCRKPLVKPFLAIANGLGSPVGAITFVGDSYEEDVLGAHDAGMAAVWLRSGTPPPSMRPALSTVREAWALDEVGEMLGLR